MVMSCCAVNCTNRWKKGVILKFHRFPKDIEIKKKWMISLRRENFTPSVHTAVCEKHFTQEDYEVNVHGNRILKKGAVPSLFDFPPHLIKSVKKRRIIKRITQKNIIEQHKENLYLTNSNIPMEVVENEILKEIEGSSKGSSNANCVEIPVSVKAITISRKRRSPVYFGDFKESDLEDEYKRKRFWKVSHNVIAKYKKKCKYYQCKMRRLKEKIKNFNMLLDNLRDDRRISAEQNFMLKEGISETQKELLLRQLNRKGSRVKFSPALRCFALTLNFYSTSAYQYVRHIFQKSLPHTRTLAKWYGSVDGTPGYTIEALRAVKIKVDVEKENGKMLTGALMLDEMSIREHIQWTGSRYVGYVNFGTGFQENDNLPKAKNVLVLMVVAINCRWKIPVAYFLINTLTAEEKANIVLGCLEQLECTGIIIKSLTFDGCSSNIAMCNWLGANLELEDMRPYFINQKTKQKVHIMLDPCHMVKLVRNTLGDWKVLYNKNNEAIKWSLFEELVKIQNESGLHCATRLRSRHLNYSTEKMKVKLAVQTLSGSVGDALEYCDKDLNIPYFRNSEATVQFCRNINNIFDVLNTRNFCSNVIYKRPLFKGSETFVKEFVRKSVEYLKSLKDHQGRNVLISSRKTGFLGLIICLLSVENLFEELVSCNVLKFLLTYKLSQDHLEMFFSAVRRRGGFSNNPTSWQFENGYKRLLIHSEIASPDSANCLAQDNTSILNVTSKHNPNNALDSLHYNDGDDNYSIQEENFTVNYKDISNRLYYTDIVEYIAGFVCRKLLKSINCNVCAKCLISTNSLSLLLNRKNRGGLCIPSKDVVKICLIGESIIRTETNISQPNILVKLITMAIRKLNVFELFLDLTDHCKDQDPLDGHILQLIRLILKFYFNIRIHHITSIKNQVENRIRQKLTKVITFSHQ